jgi:catechol 2,3-dioxygenase
MAEPIDPRADIGHVHLKVSDLERALRFYRDVLGFEVMQQLGDSAGFISAGGYHHHIGLNTWQGEGAPPPPPGARGLEDFELLLPDGPEGRLADPSGNRVLVRTSTAAG